MNTYRHRGWRRQDTFYAVLTAAAVVVVVYVSASAIGLTPTPFAGPSGRASVVVEVGVARPRSIVGTQPQVALPPAAAEVARGDSVPATAVPTAPRTIASGTRGADARSTVGLVTNNVTMTVSEAVRGVVSVLERLLLALSSNVSR